MGINSSLTKLNNNIRYIWIIFVIVTIFTSQRDLEIYVDLIDISYTIIFQYVKTVKANG